MCTVTYIPVRDGFFLSSNRDERQSRHRALEPRVYTGRTGNLLYPKDGRAGGTWFAAHESGYTAVLLNGAFLKHDPTPPYRRSRGLVMLDLVDQPDPIAGFASMDLEGIEPFTFVLADKGLLHECRWDGASRTHRLPDADRPHIWSSVTLYTADVIKERERRFAGFLHHHPLPDRDAILGFHRGERLTDPDNDMLTVSITCLEYRHSAAGKGMPFHMAYYPSLQTPVTSL